MRSLSFIFLFSIISTSSFAQWTYQGVFPPSFSDYETTAVHGLEVDSDGNIWVLDYYPRFRVTATVSDASGNDSTGTFFAGGISIFNPQGILIDSVVAYGDEWIGGEVIGQGDSRTWARNTGRGLVYDEFNEQMVVMMFTYAYRIDVDTREVVSKLEAQTFEGTKAAPAVDEFGNLYVAPVNTEFGTITKFTYDKSSNSYLNEEDLIELPTSISRTFKVFDQGNTIIWSDFTNGYLLKYQREDEFEPFEVVDTLLQGFRTESMTLNATNGLLYISSGSLNDEPTPPWTAQTWYGFNPEELSSQTVIPEDSIRWVPETGEYDAAYPRALAFTRDNSNNQDAYLGVFDSPYLHAVQKHSRSLVSIDEMSQVIPNEIEVYQNYPNPFNPTTTIQFDLNQATRISLEVFNLLGQKVETLIKNETRFGSQSIQFNASDLASGVYLYRISTKYQVITKKMILLK